jgi:large subunit ribosomal protein L32
MKWKSCSGKVTAADVPRRITMAVPKRKMSRSNTRHRRAQWRATAPRLVPVTIDGTSCLVPQHLVKAYRRGLLNPAD